MASEVDICNMALARLGDEATVTSIRPPEGSAQSDHCATFYPLARDTMLEAHAWAFATERVQLSQLADNPGWDKYRYAAPSTAIRVLGVFPSADEPNTWPYCKAFEVERAKDGSSVISTDVASGWARIIQSVLDSGRFPPVFIDGLAWLLASYLAGPVLKGDTGVKVSQDMYRTYAAVLERAKTFDASQKQQPRLYVPAGIRARM